MKDCLEVYWLKGIVEHLTSMQVYFFVAARQIQCADYSVIRFVRVINDTKRLTYFKELNRNKQLQGSGRNPIVAEHQDTF